jgi:hypothetical protein
MLEKVINLVQDERTRNIAFTATGMAALLAGQKIPAVALFARGIWGLEKGWRERHPHFDGGLAERWEKAMEFYEGTHQDRTNRFLHMVGIPMVLGGAVGLLAFRPFRPLWLASATSFAAGWALNFIGHGVFERNAPAFADDPLSFVAGPIWDLRQLRRRREPNEAEARSAA